MGPTALISTGAGMSGFVVLWEMVTGLEKGASAFESWSGRAEDHEHVVDIDAWKKREREKREMPVEM